MKSDSEIKAVIGALVRKRIETLAKECDEDWQMIWGNEAKAIEQVIVRFPDEGKKAK